MIIGITGGTGFIGKKLVLRHLGQGDTVRVLTRRVSDNTDLPTNVFMFREDLTGDPIKLKGFLDGVDILYHCAAEIRNPERMHNVHVQGTRNLIAAAGGRVGHWVQLSSVGVYGPQRHGVVTEETPLQPIGIYEKTKAESDQLVLNAAKGGAFSCSVLRPSNVYGPDMVNQSLFQLMAQINKGFFFYIGKPGASANYVHVDNVVEGLILCGKMPVAKRRIYNLSDYRLIEEFVFIIAKALNIPSPRLRLPEMPVRWLAKLLGGLPGFPLTESRVNALTTRAAYSIALIQSELGYAHRISVEDGLFQMVKAYKKGR